MFEGSLEKIKFSVETGTQLMQRSWIGVKLSWYSQRPPRPLALIDLSLHYFRGGHSEVKSDVCDEERSDDSNVEKTA